MGRAQRGRGDIAGEVEVGKTRDQGCAYLLKPQIFNTFEFLYFANISHLKALMFFDARFNVAGQVASRKQNVQAVTETIVMWIRRKLTLRMMKTVTAG